MKALARLDHCTQLAQHSQPPTHHAGSHPRHAPLVMPPRSGHAQTTTVTGVSTSVGHCRAFALLETNHRKSQGRHFAPALAVR